MAAVIVEQAEEPLTLQFLRDAMDDQTVSSFEVTPCDRPWGGDGQATVERVKFVCTDRAKACVVYKHAYVAPSQSLSEEKADEKLKSLAVELQFLRHCPATLVPAGCPVPSLIWGSYDEGARKVHMFMKDMAPDFPLQPTFMDRPHVEAALEWLASFHSAYWGAKNIPEGLWRAGSWIGLDKITPRENHMYEAIRANWKRSLTNLPALSKKLASLDKKGEAPSGLADLGHRLSNAGRAIESRVYGRVNDKLEPQTLIHGDFKVENLSFNADLPALRVAAVDFQWAGQGCGCVDVVYLLATSLKGLLWQHTEAKFVEFYFKWLVEHKVPITRVDLQRQYELCILDFSRFVLSDGQLSDRFLFPVLRAHEILSRVDEGKALSVEAYDAAFAKKRW